MTDKKTCNERMPPWFLHRCGRPAKFLCVIPQHFGDQHKKGYRCGRHAKRYEKIERIEK
jgi:hypothetical protein